MLSNYIFQLWQIAKQTFEKSCVSLYLPTRMQLYSETFVFSIFHIRIWRGKEEQYTFIIYILARNTTALQEDTVPILVMKLLEYMNMTYNNCLFACCLQFFVISVSFHMGRNLIYSLKYLHTTKSQFDNSNYRVGMCHITHIMIKQHYCLTKLNKLDF